MSPCSSAAPPGFPVSASGEESGAVVDLEVGVAMSGSCDWIVFLFGDLTRKMFAIVGAKVG